VAHGRVMSFGVAAGVAVVVVFAIVVAKRVVAHALARHELGRQVDALAMEMATWRGRHVDRIVDLGRQISSVERAVARAEDEARRAALAIDELSRGIMRRMETVEQDEEIDILVSQGRIPREHRRGPDPGW